MNTPPFVNVWHGNLDASTYCPDYFWSLLDDQQKSKAAQFTNPKLKQRHIAVRGWLRLCLADALQSPPEALEFALGAHGKPFLPQHVVDFNLSHTGNELVVAIGNIGPIGVDIERIKPRASLTELAARCFSESELNYWQHLPDDQRCPAFYRLWTQKEAFVKAVGRGIALGLEHCQIDCQNGNRFEKIPAEFGKGHQWKITALTTTDDIVGSLVTHNRSFVIHQRPLSQSLTDHVF